jgi:hypothetical protein
MEYGIHVSPAQLRKLKSGGAVTLSKKHFDDNAPHRIRVMPNTSRRINTAMKKDKGVRVALKPEEDIFVMTEEDGPVSMKEGGSTYAQRLARRTKNTFKPVGEAFQQTGDVIKRGFKKEIIDSGVGKEIAKNLIKAGTEVVLPAALGAASMLAGDPTGLSGATAANVAGRYINRAAAKAGYGAKIGGSTYSQRLARRTKNTFKGIASNPAVKELGKQLLKEGAKAAGDAISAYTGNPAAGAALEKIAVTGGDKLIETGKVSKAIKASKKSAKRVAAEIVDDYVDKTLTGVEKEVAQKALAGKYPNAKDLVYDYGKSKLETMPVPDVFGGYGMAHLTPAYIQAMRSLRMGKGMAHLTPGYSQAMHSVTVGTGVSGFRVADDRVITPATAPSSIIQLGSPYQRINSPAMSPFIAASPQLAGFKVGGSFLPSGTRGGSFLASG